MAILRNNSKEKAIQLMTNQKPPNPSLHKDEISSTTRFKKPTAKDNSSSKNNKEEAH